jgi:A/G-specific adenine glycosylase
VTQPVPALDPHLLRRLQRAVLALHRWYDQHKRDLPWRRTRDPYAIWISEVMLQQTQVATALPYYARWLEALPDVAALAAADPDDVLRLWEGLGYYRRARNLLRAAAEVVERFDGVIPAAPEAFGSLPGVGAYTTAAVLSIAFDVDLPVVDGNVRRVLARLVALEHDPRRPPGSHAVDKLAAALLPAGTAAVHNQAVMELGALVCTPRGPACEACPLAGVCRGHAAGEPERFPLRAPNKAVPHRQLEVALIFNAAGHLLLDQRPYKGFLGGLWELPKAEQAEGKRAGTALRRTLRDGFGLTVRKRRGGDLPAVDHAYSHFKVTLHPALYDVTEGASRAAEGGAWRWIAPEKIKGAVAVAGADRKVLAALRRLDSRRS